MGEKHKQAFAEWKAMLSPQQAWAKEGPVELVFEQGFLAAIKSEKDSKDEFLSVLNKYWSGTINELVEAVHKQNELIGDFLAADSHDAMNLIYLRAETIHGEIAIKVGAGETANAKVSGGGLPPSA